jgi:hypothetical protein
MELGGQMRGPGERRAAVRSRTFLAGKVIVGDALYSADCVILDLSNTGARVRVARGSQLGPQLSLLFIRDGRLVNAALAWRRGEEVGLVFTAEHDLTTDAHPNRKRIRELWEALRPRTGDA